MCDVFAQRHHLLWRPDPILHWAKRVATRAIELVASKKPSPDLDDRNAFDFKRTTTENWPSNPENAFAHLAVDDFADVVKRALPADDPLAAHPRGPVDAEFD